jgi:hypothetical protein
MRKLRAFSAFALAAALACSQASAASRAAKSIPTEVGPNRFYTLAPCRVLDTRDLTGGALGAPSLIGGLPRSFPLARHCRIPSVARAVSVNITVVGPSLSGNLHAYAADIPEPPTSVVNFKAGQIRSNNVLLSVAQDGLATITLRPDMAGGLVNVLVDVNGYWAPTGPWPPVEDWPVPTGR